MVVLLLALVGLIWLVSRPGRSEDMYISMWRQSVGQATNAISPPAQGLTGVAQPVGQMIGDAVRPVGNPLDAAGTVMTQGYGVGSHAPAHVWGAVDLALDGNNDGSADPQGTLGQPIYATHQGIVKLSPNSWPAGNHIWVLNDQYKTGYAHLQDFSVEDGQIVQRGQAIGSIGSTGQSSGPHLDYQVWQMQNGQWVNLNPLDFGALD